MLALILILTGATPAKEKNVLEFPRDVKTRKLRDTEAEKLFVRSKELHFEIEAVRAEGEQVVVRALLTHDGAAPLRLVVWPYGGAFPYGGKSPFRVGFAASSRETVRYAGEMYPPEPPLPMAITVPPRCKIRFTETIDLRNYEWSGAPEVELEWGFHFLKEPYLKGTVKIRLPKR